MDAHGLPVRILITAGTVADCSQASTLIEGLEAQYLLTNKGYDSDALVAKVETGGMKAVIPPFMPFGYAVTVSNRENTTGNCTGSGIWWKMLFCTSSAGEAFPPVMPKIPLHSWLPYTSDALHFGRLSYDDTI